MNCKNCANKEIKFIESTCINDCPVLIDCAMNKGSKFIPIKPSTDSGQLETNIMQRIGWLSERIKLTSIDKDYIIFQMKDLINNYKK